MTPAELRAHFIMLGPVKHKVTGAIATEDPRLQPDLAQKHIYTGGVISAHDPSTVESASAEPNRTITVTLSRATDDDASAMHRVTLTLHGRSTTMHEVRIEGDGSEVNTNPDEVTNHATRELALKSFYSSLRDMTDVYGFDIVERHVGPPQPSVEKSEMGV